MQRDHMLGWPGLLALVDPEPKPSHVTPRRRIYESFFVADCRTMDSDRPKPTVIGVDMGSPEGDQQCVVVRSGSNIVEACFGVWRKTPPPIGMELRFYSSATGEFDSRWDGVQWGDGWEWFDTSAEAEKPTQAEPQLKVGDRVILRGIPFASGMYGIVQAINDRVAVEWRREGGEAWCELSYEPHKLERA